MEEVKLTCGNCGTETFRPPKLEPKNAREKKQMLFHCENCGARNLRDGTAIPRNIKVQDPTKGIQDEPKEKPGGIAGIFIVLLGIVAAIAAAIFLKRPKAKPQDESSGPPKVNPLDTVR